MVLSEGSYMLFGQDQGQDGLDGQDGQSGQGGPIVCFRSVVYCSFFLKLKLVVSE